MTQEVKDYVVKHVKDLIAADSCCAQAKEAGQAWLSALGTDKEAEMTKKLIE